MLRLIFRRRINFDELQNFINICNYLSAIFSEIEKERFSELLSVSNSVSFRISAVRFGSPGTLFKSPLAHTALFTFYILARIVTVTRFTPTFIQCQPPALRARRGTHRYGTGHVTGISALQWSKGVETETYAQIQAHIMGRHLSNDVTVRRLTESLSACPTGCHTEYF